MESITQIALVVLPVLFGSGGVVMYLLSRHDSKNEKLDKILEVVEQHTDSIETISKTVTLLADEARENQHYMLSRYYAQFMYQKKITPEQKATWNRAFSSHRALGGNGETVVWDEEIQRLPVRTDFVPVSPFAVEWEKMYDKANIHNA